MRDAMQDVERAVLADLGGSTELAETRRHLITAFARCAVLADALTADMLERGLVTSRGRTRAQFGQWISLLDRMSRLAATIGLDRVQRQIGLSDYLQQHARRVNAPDTGDQR